VEDITLTQLFSQMDHHLARQDAMLARMDERRERQDEILAHHSTMLDRVDDRGRQIAAILERIDARGHAHTEAMLQISANMTHVAEVLDRSMQRLETQQTQLGDILGGMAVMLARMDEHTTMIAQILSQFQQGRNGH
jgi:prefoldin subunit 5